MVNHSSKWLIRTAHEGTQGPFMTEEIIQKIKAGIFSGEEAVAAYPDGDWKELSKELVFYDALIESLENPKVGNDQTSKKMQA